MSIDGDRPVFCFFLTVCNMSSLAWECQVNGAVVDSIELFFLIQA